MNSAKPRAIRLIRPETKLNADAVKLTSDRTRIMMCQGIIYLEFIAAELMTACGGAAVVMISPTLACLTT